MDPMIHVRTRGVDAHNPQYGLPSKRLSHAPKLLRFGLGEGGGEEPRYAILLANAEEISVRRVKPTATINLSAGWEAQLTLHAAAFHAHKVDAARQDWDISQANSFSHSH